MLNPKLGYNVSTSAVAREVSNGIRRIFSLVILKNNSPKTIWNIAKKNMSVTVLVTAEEAVTSAV
jgi:hypothetical protein